MPFTSRKFVRSRTGTPRSRVLLEGLHVVAPKQEIGVLEIVEAVSETIGCHALLATNSRVHVDLNCPPQGDLAQGAHQEYRETIRLQMEATGLLDESQRLSSPFVTFSIHGMEDSYGLDIEVGTHYGKSVSPDVCTWLLSEISKWGEEFCQKTGKEQLTVLENVRFYGWESICYHRHGNGKDYLGYGENFNYFQLEFSRTLRVKYHDHVIELLKHLSTEFERNFGSQS